MYIYMYIYINIYIYINTSLPLFMYRYFYYVHLFSENSSIFPHYFFTDVFVITWAITCLKKLHCLKISNKSFWVFWRAHFGGVIGSC